MKYNKSVLRAVTPIPLQYLQFNYSKQTIQNNYLGKGHFICPIIIISLNSRKLHHTKILVNIIST